MMRVFSIVIARVKLMRRFLKIFYDVVYINAAYLSHLEHSGHCLIATIGF